MYRRLALPIVSPLLLSLMLATPANASTPTSGFISNMGQWPSDVLFKATSAKSDFWIMRDGFIAGAIIDVNEAEGTERHAALRAHLSNADPLMTVTEATPLDAYYNYFVGDALEHQAIAATAFAEVTIHGVWPGTDVRYYFDGDRVRFDFNLATSADPSAIGIDFDGQDQLALDPAGNIQAAFASGAFEIGGLKAYEPLTQATRSSTFEVVGGHVSFSVDRTVVSEAVVIDPYIAANFVGGSGNQDYANAITSDSSSNIIITGNTNSTTLPGATGTYQTTLKGNSDAFISKFDSSLSLTWTTYLGGTSYDEGYSVVADSSGQIFVGGQTCSTDFPTKASCTTRCSPAQSTAGGSCDGFITSISSNGSTLGISTYIGGTNTDAVYGITVDPSGNVYAVGTTDQSGTTSFPTTTNAFQQTLSNTGAGYTSAFLTEVAATGRAFTYSTFLDKSHCSTADAGCDSNANAVALDPSNGQVVVVGGTDAVSFPGATGGLQSTRPTYHSNSATLSGFISRLDTSQSNSASLVQSTYLGGSTGIRMSSGKQLYNYPDQGNYVDGGPIPIEFYDSNDILKSVVVDDSGNVYVGGYTNGFDLPLTPVSASSGSGTIQSRNGGGAHDAYFAKLNSSLTSLVYGSYLGDYGDDAITGIALGSDGSLYMTGWTTTGESRFPIVGSDTATKSDDTYADSFTAKISPSGNVLLYSSVLQALSSGTHEESDAAGIAVAPNGKVYIAGATFGTSFSGISTSLSAAAQNAFVAELSPTPIAGDPTWVADFSDGGLAQWKGVICGGYNNDFPSKTNGTTVCPAWAGGTVTGSNYGPALNPCPSGSSTCRFELNDPPSSSGTGAKHMRFLVQQGDQAGNGCVPYVDGGDNGACTSDNRNELNESIENGGVKPDYNEGDERFYYVEFYLDPNTFAHDGANNAIPPALSGSGNTTPWHTLFQFHTAGICAAGSEPFEFGFDNKNNSTQYQFAVNNLLVYDYLSFTFPDGGDTYQQLWSSPPVVKVGTWYYFVFHIKWSADPSVGFVEVWMNGTHQFKKFVSTTAKWPRDCPGFFVDGGADCFCTPPPSNPSLKISEDPYYIPHFTDQSIPVFLKSGHYRNHNITGDEVLWHGGYKAGVTCDTVWPTAVYSTKCPNIGAP